MFRLHVNYLYISSLVTGLKDSAVYSTVVVWDKYMEIFFLGK